jgi:predicted nuclease of predicted toxin-antitoxin system
MAQPRFIADADFNEKIIRAVRRREPAIDFLDASDGGTRGLSDPEVLALAAATGRILVSHDRNTILGHFDEFCRKHHSPGPITVRQKANRKLVVDSLILIWAASSADEWNNVAIFVPYDAQRVDISRLAASSFA